MKLTLVSIFSIIILAGCSHHYMYREASLKSLPEIECIVSSIRDTPGVDKVHLFKGETGKRITFSGLEEPGDVYDIRYSGSFGSAQVLIINEVYKNIRTINYRHNLGSYHEILNQESIDIEREVVLKVENSIAKHCGVIEVLDSKEYCSGVTCNEI